MTTANQDWDRLAEIIRDRRESLGLTQDEAAMRSSDRVSVATWRDLEKARRSTFRRRTLYGVEDALGWPTGTVEKILRREPVDADAQAVPIHVHANPVDDPEDEDLARDLSEVAARLSEIANRIEAHFASRRDHDQDHPPGSRGGHTPRTAPR